MNGVALSTHHARLDELDRDEWREVVRIAAPQVSDEDFDLAWTEFVEFKRRRQAQ